MNSLLRFLTIALSLTAVACVKPKPIYYSYKGVTITRFDGNQADSYFYYGRFTSADSLPKDYVKTEYRGFDGIMNGYLVFEKDKRVRFVRMYDHFEQVGNHHPKLYLYQFSENIKFSNWYDIIQGNFNNNVFVADVLETEQSKNRDNHSLVKTQYPTAQYD